MKRGRGVASEYDGNKSCDVTWSIILIIIQFSRYVLACSLTAQVSFINTTNEIVKIHKNSKEVLVVVVMTMMMMMMIMMIIIIIITVKRDDCGVASSRFGLNVGCLY
jgi:hypothetical protein